MNIILVKNKIKNKLFDLIKFNCYFVSSIFINS